MCYCLPCYTFVADPLPCFKDLQVNFFQDEIVNQALNFYNVPQGLWLQITIDLKQLSRDVPARMKKKTARMVRNPLAYPLQRAEAAVILRDTLFEVCSEVLRMHYITERPTVDYIFDYIFMRQVPKMIPCLGEEVRDLVPKFE